MTIRDLVESIARLVGADNSAGEISWDDYIDNYLTKGDASTLTYFLHTIFRSKKFDSKYGIPTIIAVGSSTFSPKMWELKEEEFRFSSQPINKKYRDIDLIVMLDEPKNAIEIGADLLEILQSQGYKAALKNYTDMGFRVLSEGPVSQHIPEKMSDCHKYCVSTKLQNRTPIDLIIGFPIPQWTFEDKLLEEYTNQSSFSLLLPDYKVTVFDSQLWGTNPE